MTGYVFGAPWAMAIKVITVVTIIVVCIPVYIFITLPEGAAWLGCLMVGGPILYILTCAGYTIRGLSVRCVFAFDPSPKVDTSIGSCRP